MMPAAMFVRVIHMMDIPFTIMIKPWDRRSTYREERRDRRDGSEGSEAQRWQGESSPHIESVVSSIGELLNDIDERFSPYRADSLVSMARRGDWNALLCDPEFHEVYARSALARQVTHASFDAFAQGAYDPTGIVKGWAIEKAFRRFLRPLTYTSGNGSERPFAEAVALNGGGDMQLAVAQCSDFRWNIGIESPVAPGELIARCHLQDGAVATSGFSKRGHHIVTSPEFDVHPLSQVTILSESLTDADMWSTACLSSGELGAVDMARRNGLTMLAIRPDARLGAFELPSLAHGTPCFEVSDSMDSNPSHARMSTSIRKE